MAGKKTRTVNTIFGDVEVPDDYNPKTKAYYYPSGTLPKGFYYNHDGDLTFTDADGKEEVVCTATECRKLGSKKVMEIVSAYIAKKKDA